MFLEPAILLAACAASPPSLAAGVPTGPAAAATRQWFASDLSLGCFDPSGHIGGCGAANDPIFDILYGNADGGGGTPDAVAVVTYAPDPTGTAHGTTAAAFRKDDGGRYRFVRRLDDVQGYMVAPKSPVRFGGGKVTMTMLTLRPGDGSCCPTGHRQITLNLR